MCIVREQGGVCTAWGKVSRKLENFWQAFNKRRPALSKTPLSPYWCIFAPYGDPQTLTPSHFPGPGTLPSRETPMPITYPASSLRETPTTSHFRRDLTSQPHAPYNERVARGNLLKQNQNKSLIG